MRVILYIIYLLLLTTTYGYTQVATYVTPDTWSKHITANGVKASTSGITTSGANLKFGLTTRGQFRINGYDYDVNLYQYLRGRASNIELGNGEVVVNLNARGGWDNVARPELGKYHTYYDGLDASKGRSDLDYRIYQANIEFNEVLKYTSLHLGRVYLPTFDSYKIDGGNLSFNVHDWFKVNAFYGLPVSYYTNLETQVAGGGIEIPIDNIGTRIRGEYSYFMHNDGGDYNTHVAKLRIDQKVPFTNIYAQGNMIGKAWTYNAGFDGNIDISRTGYSAYIIGQIDKNENEINPYVSMYESELGASSEYVMGGIQLMQGIADYAMLAAGFEARYNFNENYGDRNYYRAFATLDLVGLIHNDNYLSIIADYYTVAKYMLQDENSKLLVGLRMTQVLNENIELWLGANVMNYQYGANPIRNYKIEVDTGFSGISQKKEEENTTLAYIGGMYRPTDWCVIQLDYTFEYSDIFDKVDTSMDLHMIELWINFIW